MFDFKKDFLVEMAIRHSKSQYLRDKGFLVFGEGAIFKFSFSQKKKNYREVLRAWRETEAGTHLLRGGGGINHIHTGREAQRLQTNP